MKKIIFLITLFITSLTQLVTANDFTLITVLYNETHPARMKEYIYCLEKNLNHSNIKQIHVLYDTSKDKTTNQILDYLIQHNITITYISDRPTYDFCFSLANELYPNEKILLCNADIYYNETLASLENYDLENRFIVLTRWNVLRNGKLKQMYSRRRKPNIWSHDTWIFKTPIREFEDKTIQLGTTYCDCRIAYQAQQAGYKVINPCLSIKSCHLHLSGVRHQPKMGGKYLTLGIPWSKLSDD